MTLGGTGTFTVTTSGNTTLNQTATLTAGSGGVSVTVEDLVISSGGLTSSGPISLVGPDSIVLTAPIRVTGASQTLAISGASGVDLGSTLTTTGGTVTVSGAATLLENTMVDTTDGGNVLAGANVTFSTLTAETTTSQEVLTINAGASGDVSLNRLSFSLGLTVNDADSVILVSTSANSVSSIDVQASSTFQSLGRINTVGTVQITAGQLPFSWPRWN